MLTLLLGLQAAAAQAPTLWQNVKAGMTLEELKTARPASRPISAEEKGHWFEGCDIADDKVSLEGVVLDVCYATQHGRITSVVLHTPLQDHRGAADRLKPALAGKYGAPLMDVCGGFDRIFAQQRCNTVWKHGAVTVTADRFKLAHRNSITLKLRADADAR